MFKSILCPIDGSETSAEALDIAARLAAEQGASLTVCTVVNPSKASAMAFGDPAMSAACFNALDDEARAMVTETVEQVKNVIPAESVCLNGETVPSIVNCAERQHADLIVMGSHGRTGISRAVIGSVAEGVVRYATVPVLIVRSARKIGARGSVQDAGTAVPAK